MARGSELVALKGSIAPVRRFELLPEEQPRLCLANDLAAETLAAPIRRLVSICEAAAPVELAQATIGDRLVEHWRAGLGEAVWQLARDGQEAMALGPIAAHPPAARLLADRLSRSDALQDRKLAAMLLCRLAAEAPATGLGAPPSGTDCGAGRPASDAPADAAAAREWDAEAQRRLELFMGLAATAR
jgi:hypothetical protein